MSFELNDQGIQVQTLTEILSELETAARADVHPQLDVSASSPFGQLFGIWAERELLIQQALRAVAQSFGPKSTGQSLANIALLTGTVKRGQTKSQVDATVTLTAGTTLPAGSRANVDGDSTAIFETVADVTNGAGITAAVAATMRAVTAGPVRAPAGKLTVINTPVSGWSAVTNAFDATVGLDIEGDPALRLRRLEELRVQGSTVVAAIVADVLEVAGVLAATGYENTGDATDIDGLDPHSFEIVVWDGVSPAASNTAVAQAIFNGAPAGIKSTHGTNGVSASGSALDKEGAAHTVLFTRPTQLTLYVTYTLQVDSGVYPVDGDAQVKAAVVAMLTSLLSIGADVITSKLYAPAFSVAGVTDVTSIKLGFTASPFSSANLNVGSRSIAVADTSRITVIT